jgi:hypothetical protein
VSFSRLRAYLDAQRLANLLVIALVLYVVLWALHPSLLLSSSTITGGDTGAHVATALYLRQHWGTGALTSWDPGWFDGFPLYSYYFVLPDAIAAAASYLIPYTIAFKLMTTLGSLLLPISAYVMGRLFRAPHPVPAALAGATLPFLFESSYTILGGNLFSTLAGEYAFSLSLSLALVTIGLFARGVRTGRGRWVAAVALSATLAAHLLPWLYAITVVALLLALELVFSPRFFRYAHPELTSRRHGRRAIWFVLSAGVLSAGLSAWWLLPFATSQQYTTVMGYSNASTQNLHDIFSQLGWFNSSGGAAGSRWVIVLAAAGFLAACFWRSRLGLTLSGAALLALTAFAFDPQGAIWNERLIPFWFISVYLGAGWFVGTLAHRVAVRWPLRRAVDGTDDVDGRDVVRRRVVAMTYLIAALAMVSTVPGLVPALASAVGVHPGANQPSNWAAYNYEGYQGQAAWPEYHGIITTMQRVSRTHGCGRAMWEYDSDEGRFGSPMALMLLPYWTDNCVDSMEGLLFESSATTPYHFLDQAELSDQPSNPVVGLDYGPVDVTLGVEHLQLLGVRYFIAFSPDVVAAADRDPSLVPVALTRRWVSSGVRWHVYLIRHSPLVAPVGDLPNVVAGIDTQKSWLRANQRWWLNPAKWPVLDAASGPANWPRVRSSDHVVVRAAATTRVSRVVAADQSLSFHVSRVGVPVVVRISYYPRWHAHGATGPFRVSPNLMVVIPTSHDVSLTYGASPAVSWGNLLTDLTVVALVVALWRRRWWRRPRERRAISAAP